MVNNRRWRAYFINYFVHARLSTLKPIRAALTSQDLSSGTKFAQTQSRVTLPLSKKQVSWARKIIEAKRSEKFEAKGSEKKRNFSFLVSRNEAKIKRNVMLFRYFRFEAKNKNKRKWDTLALRAFLSEKCSDGRFR